MLIVFLDIHVFKDLERHEEEEQMEIERSPSPSCRPEHPMHPGLMFRKNDSTGAQKKPRTLASVLEKHTKKDHTHSMNSSLKGKKLVTPGAFLRKEHEPDTESLKSSVQNVKKASYYTQSLHNQSKKYKTSVNSKAHGDTGADDSVKPCDKKPTIVNRMTKGVKLAKFDLCDSTVQNNRTKTPRKTGIERNMLATPKSNSRSNLKTKVYQSATKSKDPSSERKPKQEVHSRTMKVSRPATAKQGMHKSPMRDLRATKPEPKKIHEEKKSTLKKPVTKSKFFT